MGKYEYQVNDLQKHMKEVAWWNPNSSVYTYHLTRTGCGLPQHTSRVTTCCIWQWPICTCQFALGPASVPSIPCWGLCLWPLGSQNRWHNTEHWSQPKFTPGHATLATRGEECVAALSKECGHLCMAAVYLPLKKCHKSIGFKVASATAAGTGTLELSSYSWHGFLKSCSNLLSVLHQMLSPSFHSVVETFAQ